MLAFEELNAHEAVVFSVQRDESGCAGRRKDLEGGASRRERVAGEVADRVGCVVVGDLRVLRFGLYRALIIQVIRLRTTWPELSVIGEAGSVGQAVAQ